jgi:hypothetical protein
LVEEETLRGGLCDVFAYDVLDAGTLEESLLAFHLRMGRERGEWEKETADAKKKNRRRSPLSLPVCPSSAGTVCVGHLSKNV